MKLGEYLCKSFTFMISLLAHDHGYGPVIQYIIFTSLTTVYYGNSACTHCSKTGLVDFLGKSQRVVADSMCHITAK